MKLYTLNNEFIEDSTEVPINFTGIIENSDGSKEWYVEGKRHREDGPACEWPDGSKYWYTNNKLHRIDGPACEYSNGPKIWYLNGRLEGPAIENEDGTKRWFLFGKKSTIEEYNLYIDLLKLKGLL